MVMEALRQNNLERGTVEQWLARKVDDIAGILDVEIVAVTVNHTLFAIPIKSILITIIHT